MTKNPTETFTLGHSPDPDDAFVFYAIAKDKYHETAQNEGRDSDNRRANAPPTPHSRPEP